MEIIIADFYRIIKGKLGLISLVMILGLIGLAFFALSYQYQNSNVGLTVLNLVSSFIPIFLTNIYMIIWGDEFSHRVINNILINKISRIKVAIIKFVLVYVLTVIVLLFVITMIKIIGSILGVHVDLIILLIRVGIQCFAYFVLTGLAAVLFTYLSKPYVAVALFISYTLIVENLAVNVISAYFPKLIPFIKTLPTFILSSSVNLETFSRQFVMTSMIASLGYGILLFIMSCIIFVKKEFK